MIFSWYTKVQVEEGVESGSDCCGGVEVFVGQHDGLWRGKAVLICAVRSMKQLAHLPQQDHQKFKSVGRSFSFGSPCQHLR